jgi:hypothetical protein
VAACIPRSRALINLLVTAKTSLTLVQNMPFLFIHAILSPIIFHVVALSMLLDVRKIISSWGLKQGS